MKIKIQVGLIQQLIEMNKPNIQIEKTRVRKIDLHV
jgi:hypothetical protein